MIAFYNAADIYIERALYYHEIDQSVDPLSVSERNAYPWLEEAKKKAQEIGDIAARFSLEVDWTLMEVNSLQCNKELAQRCEWFELLCDKIPKLAEIVNIPTTR